MAEEVLKGYSPEELDRWETKERIQWARLGLTAMCSCIVFAVLACVYQDRGIWGDILFMCTIAMMSMAFYTVLLNDNHFRFRKRVCRALAGIELGIVHCSDDLVILLGIDRIYADRIINGDYDFLMNHKDFCKFMPTKDSM